MSVRLEVGSSMMISGIERQCLGDLDQLHLGDGEVRDRVLRAEVGNEALRMGATSSFIAARSTVERPPHNGSRPIMTLAATSRLSKRLSS